MRQEEVRGECTVGVAEVVGGQLNGNVNAGQLQPAMSAHQSQAPFNKLGHKLSAGGGSWQLPQRYREKGR